MTNRRITALMLSLMLTLTMMPFVPQCVFAESSSKADDKVLNEIASQMQDTNSDPFAFRGTSGELKVQEALPESFDLRDVDGDGDADTDPLDDCYVTPVKFQNPFGTCWGFAAIAAAETSILGNSEINNGIDADTFDLSEKHLAWFTYQPIKDQSNLQYDEGGHFDGDRSAQAYNLGGLPFYATSLFATGMGPVTENLKSDGSLEYHGKERIVSLRDLKNKTIIPVKESEITGDQLDMMYCYSETDDWSLPDSFRYLQSYRLKESYLLPTPSRKEGAERTEAIGAIKEQLRNKRAVEIAFHADTSKPISDGEEQPTVYISPNWAHYTYNNAAANHAVTIIGWDDKYPKENFRHKIKDKDDSDAYILTTPEHDGAWLVKNSWGAATRDFPYKGPGWGLLEGQDKAPYTAREGAQNTGYFWLSYDDKSITMIEALDFDLSNVDKDYLAYQHDYMPVGGVESAFLSDKTSMANVFTSELPSRIEQVTCQTTTPGTEVHYDVYFLRNGASSPVDGRKVAEMDATYKYGGFHKENLPEPVTAGTGQKFSVVVTQKTPDDLYTINVQTAENKAKIDEYNKGKDPENQILCYSKGVVNEGESFFLTGSTWHDLSEKWIQDLIEGQNGPYLDMDNFAIKVFATEGEEPADRDSEDVIPFGKGASSAAAEKAALAWKADTDPAGTVFAPLLLKSNARTKKSISLSWKQQKNASVYMIYGAASGKKNALKKVAVVNSNSYTVNNIAGKALKKGKYYKFIIVALNSEEKVVSSSKMIHVATKGGKVRNYKSVKIRKPKNAKLGLKKGRSYKIKAKATGSKVSKKRALRYESTNPSIAAVTSKGKIKAVSAGSCRIRVYAQNGVYKTIKLSVK